MNPDLPNEYRYPDGPPTPEEVEENWAEELGEDHGYNLIGKELDDRLAANAALSGEVTKPAYIRGYQRGFQRRKIEEGHDFDIFGANDMTWLWKHAEADQLAFGPWPNYTRR
jgi:hypothetical protein